MQFTQKIQHDFPTCVQITNALVVFGSELTFAAGSMEYIRLEDITNNFVYPCIMDIKVGEQTWLPTASERKKSRQMVSYTLSY